MNNKIIASVDLTKINKDRIRVETYTNKEGVEVTKKIYDFEVIPLKPEQQKEIAAGAGWTLKKTHFITDAANKEERAAKTKMATLGEGKQFLNWEQSEAEQSQVIPDDANPASIPF
jgi:pyridoxine 5'-phosphate synthase PdxJ